MDLRALIFDINGTLIDIETDERREDAFRALTHFLVYQGVSIGWRELRDLYFETMRRQHAASPEAHPEIDVVSVWRALLEQHATGLPDALPVEKFRQLPLTLAEMHRALVRVRLRPFPEVRTVLEQMRPRFRLAIVSDHQTPYGLPELRAVGLRDFFDPVVISADHGFRKPDPRLFQYALAGVQARPDQAVYIGNDPYHDVGGAHAAGMKCVLFSSGPVKAHPFSTPADYVIYHFGQLPEAVRYLASPSHNESTHS
jgi:putative hydrolase of the HAD superfamily